MHIQELIAKTGVAERQIRYLVAEGFVPPPSGGRANADYGTEHVSAIKRYMRLRELGFPPAAIKLLLQSREGAPFTILPGITLVIDPELLGSGTPTRQLIKRIETVLTDLMKGTANANRKPKTSSN